jgi:hypothetical protein
MLSVFRNPSFTSLWVGQLISGRCSVLTTPAASILVYRFTGSLCSMGLLLIATAGMLILVGLFAVTFVGGFARKRILLISDLLGAFLIFPTGSSLNQNLLGELRTNTPEMGQ